MLFGLNCTMRIIDVPSNTLAIIAYLTCFELFNLLSSGLEVKPILYTYSYKIQLENLKRYGYYVRNCLNICTVGQKLLLLKYSYERSTVCITN